MDNRPVVIASNRGPLSFRQDETTGELHARRGAGGLVSGLLPLVAGTDTVWIAAAMSPADRAAAADGVVEAEGVRARLLALDPDDFRAAYDVIGNATLWFLHHGLFDTPHRPHIDRRWHQAWEAYRRVNEAFAEAIAATAPPGAAVLVQDYHLALVGPMLREARPDVATAHFSHTPFAGPDLLAVLPRAPRRELLAGIAGHDACGFHTERWAASFVASCHADGIEVPTTFVAPLGPDPDDLGAVATSEACAQARQALGERIGERQLVLRVDRLELSKNLLRGFLAFDALLERYPQHRGRVVFWASVYPSREGLPEYLAYRQEVEHLVARINRRWRQDDWEPVVLDLSDDFPSSVAALTTYDVLLVNPVRDGLNLVAKEGPVLNERHGVVALSTEAGAFAELAPAALAVDPFDLDGTADVLHEALTASAEDRLARAGHLRAIALARTPGDWLQDQLAALA